MENIFIYLGYVIYFVMAMIALWGAFCVVMVAARVRQKQFVSEDQQRLFLEAIEEQLGVPKVQQLVADRFQRDVLQDLEYRLSWVYTVIKAAPMIGLLGTVLGMMAAFAKLAIPNANVEVAKLAQDIQFALITTALGLTIAIPLVMATAYINIKIKKMEDLVSYGINQFLEIFKEANIRFPNA